MATREITAPTGVKLRTWGDQQGLINYARAARILRITPDEIPALIQDETLTKVVVRYDGRRTASRLLVTEVTALAADDVCFGCGVSARRRRVCPHCSRSLPPELKRRIAHSTTGTIGRPLWREVRLHFAKNSTYRVTHRASPEECLFDVGLELSVAESPTVGADELRDNLGHSAVDVDAALADLARRRVLRWEAQHRVRLLDRHGLGRLLDELERSLPAGG